MFVVTVGLCSATVIGAEDLVSLAIAGWSRRANRVYALILRVVRGLIYIEERLSSHLRLVLQLRDRGRKVQRDPVEEHPTLP